MSRPELIAEACRWLRFAREDLAGAEGMLAREAFLPRHVCWLAQQAAEKALKAALVAGGNGGGCDARGLAGPCGVRIGGG